MSSKGRHSISAPRLRTQRLGPRGTVSSRTDTPAAILPLAQVRNLDVAIADEDGWPVGSTNTIELAGHYQPLQLAAERS